MIDVLVLRFEAPLMSFGDVAIDSKRPTRMFPTQSMITGLCANALGHGHHEPDRTGALQARIRFAARRDREGEMLRDYHTVDLGQKDSRGVYWMADTGWTTHGAPECRGGDSKNRMGTHQRERFYLADAIYTVVLALSPSESEESPSLESLEAALQEPARPLFLGRKTCIPASPILVGRTSASTLLSALSTAPLANRSTIRDGRVLAEWPDDGTETDILKSRRSAITDERDWANQIHVGRRFVREGMLTLEMK
jgi:CRISPR system Cascade subunit CasD